MIVAVSVAYHMTQWFFIQTLPAALRTVCTVSTYSTWIHVRFLTNKKTFTLEKTFLMRFAIAFK